MTFGVISIKISMLFMTRSSTDDVEVVMCPASGSPGYYCNSDVSACCMYRVSISVFLSPYDMDAQAM